MLTSLLELPVMSKTAGGEVGEIGENVPTCAAVFGPFALPVGIAGVARGFLGPLS